MATPLMAYPGTVPAHAAAPNPALHPTDPDEVVSYMVWRIENLDRFARGLALPAEVHWDLAHAVQLLRLGALQVVAHYRAGGQISEGLAQAATEALLAGPPEEARPAGHPAPAPGRKRPSRLAWTTLHSLAVGVTALAGAGAGYALGGL